MTRDALVVGVLVGGKGRRMGGMPKGLLEVFGEPIVKRTVGFARSVTDDVLLVGNAADYASLGYLAIADTCDERGPLGGLVALFAYAEARGKHAIAIACDMPFVSGVLLARLASEALDAAVLAPRHERGWEPLFARYDARKALPAARDALGVGRLSLQPLLDELGAHELALTEQERGTLRDWDRPEDLS